MVEVVMVANGCLEVVVGSRIVLVLRLKSLSCAILDGRTGVDLMEEMVNGRNRADQGRIKHESKLKS